MRLGHAWPESLTAQLNDLRRSCARGLGGPTQADAFRLEAHTVEAPFIYQPMPNAAGTIIVGPSWMLPEIELTALTVGDVTLQEGSCCGTATLMIGPDKVNTRGKTCPRSFECNCPSCRCCAETSGRSEETHKQVG